MAGAEELIRQKQQVEEARHQMRVGEILRKNQADQQRLAQEQQNQLLSYQSQAATRNADAQLKTAAMQIDQRLREAQRQQPGGQQASGPQQSEPILGAPQSFDGTRTDLETMGGIGPNEMAASSSAAPSPQEAPVQLAQQQAAPQYGAATTTQTPYGPLAPYIERQAIRQGTQRDPLGWHSVTETTTTRIPNILTAYQAGQLDIDERRLQEQTNNAAQKLALDRNKVSQQITLDVMNETRNPQLAEALGHAIANGDRASAQALLGLIGPTATYLKVKAQTAEAFSAMGANQARTNAADAAADSSRMSIETKRQDFMDQQLQPLADAIAGVGIETRTPQDVNALARQVSTYPTEWQNRLTELAQAARVKTRPGLRTSLIGQEATQQDMQDQKLLPFAKELAAAGLSSHTPEASRALADRLAAYTPQEQHRLAELTGGQIAALQADAPSIVKTFRTIDQVPEGFRDAVIESVLNKDQPAKLLTTKTMSGIEDTAQYYSFMRDRVAQIDARAANQPLAGWGPRLARYGLNLKGNALSLLHERLSGADRKQLDDLNFFYTENTQVLADTVFRMGGKTLTPLERETYSKLIVDPDKDSPDTADYKLRRLILVANNMLGKKTKYEKDRPGENPLLVPDSVFQQDLAAELQKLTTEGQSRGLSMTDAFRSARGDMERRYNMAPLSLPRVISGRP